MKPEWIDFHLERYKSRSQWLLENGDHDQEIASMRSFLMSIKEMCDSQRAEVSELFQVQDNACK